MKKILICLFFIFNISISYSRSSLQEDNLDRGNSESRYETNNNSLTAIEYSYNDEDDYSPAPVPLPVSVPNVQPSSYDSYSESYKGWRVDGYSYGTNLENFILGGCLGQSCSRGTYWDEWAVIGAVAIKIVEHGGYFCPIQIQVANRRQYGDFWFVFFQPKGGEKSKECYWFCEYGYSGEGCSKIDTSGFVPCDNKKHDSYSLFSNISLKTEGGWSNKQNIEIIKKYENGYLPFIVTVGITKYGEHGVIAKAIDFVGGHSFSPDPILNTYIIGGKLAKEYKLLCASGYKPNYNNTDCIPINEELCKNGGNPNFCSDFPKDKYKNNEHYLKFDNGCVKYFCKNEYGYKYGFPKEGDFSCESCGEITDVKTGINLNGICVKCETGKYFDESSKTCKNAKALTNTDLQYGVGRTFNSRFDEQCWLEIAPADYRKCMYKY